tara:strand:+ start:1178 stop:1786 length:609 start_codon:yes stop_codon:yes gene_type:complete
MEGRGSSPRQSSNSGTHIVQNVINAVAYALLFDKLFLRLCYGTGDGKLESPRKSVGSENTMSATDISQSIIKDSGSFWFDKDSNGGKDEEDGKDRKGKTESEEEKEGKTEDKPCESTPPDGESESDAITPRGTGDSILDLELTKGKTIKKEKRMLFQSQDGKTDLSSLFLDSTHSVAGESGEGVFHSRQLFFFFLFSSIDLF